MNDSTEKKTDGSATSQCCQCDYSLAFLNADAGSSAVVSNIFAVYFKAEKIFLRRSRNAPEERARAITAGCAAV